MLVGIDRFLLLGNRFSRSCSARDYCFSAGGGGERWECSVSECCVFLTAIVLGPRLTPGRFCLPLTLPEIVNGDADAGIRDTQRSCFRRAEKR